MGRLLGIFTLVCLLCISCEKKEPKLFVKLPSSNTGIDFRNDLEDTPELNILTYLYYYNGAGIAAADFNKDSLIDLYFTSNLGHDKLYLNEGGMKFKEVTNAAGIKDENSWSTGVTYVDINSDGLLDIYVCKASGYRSLKGKNLLYENQGLDENGIPQFIENAAEYGLDFSGLSTQAAFFDYDLDGDLDLFLMNHSVHPNRAYGRGVQRTEFDPRSGDRLYRNENGKFEDISAEAGIYQGKIGYGLGLGIGDIDLNGYPDVYVGNDFFENDYLYINNGDGSFMEIISDDPTRLGHTSHYSMGNDLADVNNDGLLDMVSLDMLPKDLETYKASGLEFPFPTYQYYLKNGYAPQYMQNTLHLNLGNATFSEIGHLSGIAATEWSWGALLADYDNDGYRDLFVTNGIKGATNDMDFVNFISNEEIQRSIDRGMSEAEMNLIDKIPETRVPNYIYKNLGNLKFRETTDSWLDTGPSFSHGSVYADLDRDGDLDLVVNNVDDEAYVLENTSGKENSFLELGFEGNPSNRLGIGCKVTIYSSGKTFYGENQITKGYLSSVPPTLHFGLGEIQSMDSIVVQWPTGESQSLKNIAANQTVILKQAEAKEKEIPSGADDVKNRIPSKINPHLSYRHKDQTSIEFNRNPLVPFASTNEGPAIAVADMDQDGYDDLFIGGAKRQPSALFKQDSNGNFSVTQEELFPQDEKNEDVAAAFFDANGDNWQDLIVVSGGNEYQSGTQLQPRLYINENGVLKKDSSQFRDIFLNASKVKATDIDLDGDLDLTISADLVPWEFGQTPAQYVFENNGSGGFEDITASFASEFQYAGNVKDIIWKDLDGNGFPDLVVAGYWMPVQVYLNSGTELSLQKDNKLENSHGWWSSIEVVDWDMDGDLDIIAGNFGENSLLQAAEDAPITLYRQDFDDNGSVETLVTYFREGKETALASKDELVKQMPYLNKEFLSYKSFARASLRELFSEAKLEDAERKYVYTLGSTYFENRGEEGYIAHKLPIIAQASTIRDIGIEDFNSDGYPDLYLIGNNYEISTQLGSMDASHGVILQNDKNNGFIWVNDDTYKVSGPARNLTNIRIQNREYYIIGVNNETPAFIPKIN